MNNYELNTLKEALEKKLDVFSLKDFRKYCGQKFNIKRNDGSKIFFEFKRRGTITGNRNKGFFFR